MASQKAQVRQSLANYMNRKATTVQESRTTMSELDRTIKRYVEIVGEEPAGDFIQGIVESVLDNHTLQYMLGHDVEGEMDSKAYREKVTQYLTTMCFSDRPSKANAMDLDNIEESTGTADERSTEDTPSSESYGGDLGAFQGNCWNCGGFGHSANQCPTKGKGGGKGGGKKGGYGGKKGSPPPPPPSKGGGKDKGGGFGPTKGDTKGQGKGPCWICKGPHMQRDCPMNQGGGKGYPSPATQFNGWGKGPGWTQGGIRMLHSLETITPKSEEEVLEWIIPEDMMTKETVEGPTAADHTEALLTPTEKIEPPPAPEADWTIYRTKATKKKEKKKHTLCTDECCRLGLLETVSPIEEFNAVGEWEELVFAVDS